MDGWTDGQMDGQPQTPGSGPSAKLGALMEKS